MVTNMKKIDINNNWLFCRDHTSIMSAFQPDPEEKITVHLPHDAMLTGKRERHNPSGAAGAYYPGENYLYEKLLFVPADWKGQKLILAFEGVYHTCLVYVNGQFVSSNDYGYSEFEADPAPFFHYGEDNLICVKVQNGMVPNTRWYSGAGIYRPVYLWIGSDLHIKKDGIRITTPNVSKEISQVNTEISLINTSTLLRRIQLLIELIDAAGKKVSCQSVPVTMLPQSEELFHEALYIKNANLWNIDTPALYTANVTILEDENCCDSDAVTFGIRHLQVDPAHGIRINGVDTLLRGACIHHDHGILGAAEYEVAAVRKIRILKDAGFNAIRTSHNPASQAILNACDKLGMLVMDESFDQWTRTKNPYDYAINFSLTWKKHIERVIQKDYNHPSVIFYCIGNEIQELATPQGAKLNREIANFVRSHDNTRIVTNAINGMMTVMESMDLILKDLNIVGNNKGDVNDVMTNLIEHNDEMTSHPFLIDRLEEVFLALDVAGYNYMRSRGVIDTQRDANRIVVGSETFPADIDLNWALCTKNPAILGDFTWTGWDYLGEAGIGIEKYQSNAFHSPWPAYLAYCGDIDFTGNRRPFSYYREIVFGLCKTPYIAVQYPERYKKAYFGTPWSVPESVSSWSFEGHEGNPCIIEVYADAPEVELLINGRSMGKKTCGRQHRFKALFDVKYEPGELKAVAYRNGRESESYVLVSAGAKTQIHVSADHSLLNAGGQDLAFINITVTDENGVLKPYHQEKIKVSVSGAGTLMGVASANPITEEQFGDTVHMTYLGRLQAIVRSGMTPGKIKVHAATESGMTETVELAVQ